MAGINSLGGVCPVGARTGRQKPRWSYPTSTRRGRHPISDLPRPLCDTRLRRTTRRIASGFELSRVPWALVM